MLSIVLVLLLSEDTVPKIIKCAVSNLVDHQVPRRPTLHGVPRSPRGPLTKVSHQLSKPSRRPDTSADVKMSDRLIGCKF
jgi:hypothetical protein